MTTFKLSIKPVPGDHSDREMLSLQPSVPAEGEFIVSPVQIEQKVTLIESPVLSKQAEQFIKILSVTFGVNDKTARLYERAAVPQVIEELARIGWQMRGQYAEIDLPFDIKLCPMDDLINSCEPAHDLAVTEMQEKLTENIRGKLASHFLLKDMFVMGLNSSSVLLGWKGHSKVGLDD